MLHADFRRGVLLDVLAQVRLAGVAVQWSPATATYDFVDAVLAARVSVPFDPMLEQVLVSSQHQLDMVLTKKRHVATPQRGGLNLDGRSAVGAGGERGVVTHRDHVHITPAIETLELLADPFILHRVVGDN